MPGNEILHEDKILRVATRKNVVLAVWNDVPTVTQIRAFQRASELVAKRGQKDELLLSTVVRGVPKFTEDVRDEMVRMVKNRSLYPLGTTHLILLDGMAGTAVRAFLSTVKLLSRLPTPTGVFSKTDEALLWSLDRLRGSQQRWAYSELKDALDEAILGH